MRFSIGEIEKLKNIGDMINLLEKLNETKKASFQIKITNKNILDFVKISGDKNKLHTEKLFARKLGFKDTVIHGAYIISQFSKLIGNKLPGNGSLILFSEYKFHYPAYKNRKIVIEGKVVSWSKSTSTYNLDLVAKYKDGRIISTGNVTVRAKL